MLSNQTISNSTDLGAIEFKLKLWAFNTINNPKNVPTAPLNIREDISHIEQLPLLPVIAGQILQIINNPCAEAKDLAAIVRSDPILTAQIMHWATSSLFGYRGSLCSVEDAIIRVLGYDYVLNAIFSLTLLTPLNYPKLGGVGAKSMWVQALLSVKLMQVLNKKLPAQLQQNTHEIFLAAFLHNIGYAVFAHFFTKEFMFLNKGIEQNPKIEIIQLERFIFDIDHGLLGSTLMKNWQMPAFLIEVMKYHHNPHYTGEYWVINSLTYCSDYWIGQLGIGDAQNQNCPESVYQNLGLKEQQCYEQMLQLKQDLHETLLIAEHLTSKFSHL